MKLKLFAAAFAAAFSLPAAAQTEIQWWHSMGGALGEWVNDLAKDFNGSQKDYKIVPVFKGSYDESMTAAIAAFRAGNAPHVVQMYEVGTATMMAAGKAIKPAHELMAEAGMPLDTDSYLPSVGGYYAAKDGKLMALPFNSSTAIMFYNKDAFQKAGLNTDKAPATWPELLDAAKKLKASGSACPLTAAWPVWTLFEQFSAAHNLPFASESNGFDSAKAELKIDSPLHVRQVQTLIDMQKDGLFKYGGRDSTADALFPSGECAMIFGSSGLRARVARDAKFAWGAAMLPYWPDVKDAPKNSIIGGAAFWTMTSPKRTDAEYKAVAQFFKYLGQPSIDAKWHMDTGYLPVTARGYEEAKAAGFYDKNPGADIPYLQMTRSETTENTRGLRLGNLPEIRNIIQEELEKAFQGQQSAQETLNKAVQRGNTVLRNFERANKS